MDEHSIEDQTLVVAFQTLAQDLDPWADPSTWATFDSDGNIVNLNELTNVTAKMQNPAAGMSVSEALAMGLTPHFGENYLTEIDIWWTDDRPYWTQFLVPWGYVPGVAWMGAHAPEEIDKALAKEGSWYENVFMPQFALPAELDHLRRATVIVE